MTTTASPPATSPPATGRLRAVWRAAHAPVAGVPRWARLAASAIPLVVLPSSLWRIAGVTFHLPITFGLADNPQAAGTLPSWLPLELYVILLSIVSELVAFTAVGLVATWGEVFPRWLPGLHGRRVPVLAAVVPATLGATILTLLWTWVGVTSAQGLRIDGTPNTSDFSLLMTFDSWQNLLFAAAYVPLLAWGPLLAAVTVAYYRRRARGPAAPA